MGIFRLRMRKRTAEKTNERQSGKERIPIISLGIVVKSSQNRGLDADSPATSCNAIKETGYSETLKQTKKV